MGRKDSLSPVDAEWKQTFLPKYMPITVVLHPLSSNGSGGRMHTILLQSPLVSASAQEEKPMASVLTNTGTKNSTNNKIIFTPHFFTLQ